MAEIKRYKLDTALAALQQFDAFSKDSDFIEISLWHNGEGFDVHLSSCGDQHFQLTWGQFRAVKKLIKELESN
ncbi:MAG: Synechococcus phage [Pseudomonadota bacterium]|jgi:hypothetical protein